MHGHWRQEGLAEYLSIIVYPCSYNRMLFEDVGLGRYFFDEAIEKFGPIIYERYTRYTSNELCFTSFDMRALIDAIAYTLLFAYDEDGLLRRLSILKPLYHLPYINSNLEGDGIGNKKSYLEASSFIAFLADSYTFETTLRLTETWVSVEEIFGKSYEELWNEWTDWLSR